MLRKDADAKPAYGDVVGAPASTLTSAGEVTNPPPGGARESGSSSLRTLLILGGLLFIPVCVAGIVVAVVVSRRRRSIAQPTPPNLDGPAHNVRTGSGPPHEHLQRN
ncbi:hypothetical protein [Pengzhenrongella sp.]|uniref:hypothetical protein n=1 Tax=Pengzhenrongella sp. TaxID=2888820 RepID=UPI002F939908